MLIVLSPAKRLDFDKAPRTKDFTIPEHLEDSEYLIGKLRKLSSRQLEKMMGVSSDIAQLNEERYKTWSVPFDLKNSKQAVHAFKGDVYVGLDADNFSKKDLDFAQKNVRILSGLYGVLRPLDLMQAYRLEMGTRLKVTATRSNLYKYWDDRITKGILKAMETEGSEDLVNLASAEYFKAIKTDLLKKNIVTPIFKDYKNGEYKVIQFLAKKARGYMTSYIVKNKLENIEDIKGFDSEGYAFNAKMTEKNNWVFTRNN